jgi:hypothetical protein
MNKLELTPLYLKGKYNEHYIKHLKEKGFIEFRESIFLNDILELGVLDIRLERELLKTHRKIAKRIKTFYKEFILK